MLYVFRGLTLITVLISLFAPAVGNFEKDLEANGLSQAQTKMKLTRTNAENSQATSFGVNKGVTVLGDSVALRSKDQLESSIDNVAIDAVVSRNLSTINDLLRMLSLLVVLMRLTTIKALLIKLSRIYLRVTILSL